MKNKILIIVTILIVNSCTTINKNNTSKSTSISNAEIKTTKNFKSEYIVSDTISADNDIFFKYKKTDRIDSLFVRFKLDKRSFDEFENYRINAIMMTASYLPENSECVWSSGRISNSKFDRKSKVISGYVVLSGGDLDTINSVYIDVFGRENRMTKISELYTYNNTIELLGKKNTYLDHKAFLKNNAIFENISKGDKIESILVTVKTNKIIEDLTRFNVKLNNKIDLVFRTSVMADYKGRIQRTNKKVTLYNFLYQHRNFLSFKLNVAELKLKSIDEIEVKLSN